MTRRVLAVLWAFAWCLQPALVPRAAAGDLEAPTWAARRYVPERGAVGLQWNGVEGADSYDILRGEAGGEARKVGSVTGLQYLDAAVEEGKDYTYQVRATRAGAPGPPSSPATVSCIDPAKVPPPPPVWLEVLTERAGSEGGQDAAVRLLWSPGTDIIAYNVYRRAGGGGFDYLTTTTDPRHTDRPVSEGTDYAYRLTALNRLMVESGPSEERNVRVDAVKAEQSARVANVLRLVSTRVVRLVVGDDQVPLQAPVDLAMGLEGRVYVLDNQLPGVLAFDGDGEFQGVIAGGGTGPDRLLRSPYGIDAAPDGSIWVTDRKRSSEVVNLDASGRVRFSFVFAPPPREETLERMDPRCRNEMPFALDVAVAPDGVLLLTDNTFHRVCRFDARGTYLGEFGLPGDGPGEFNRPAKIAVDTEGRIFVLDSQNRRVQVFDSGGEHLFDIGRSTTMVGAFLGLSGIAFVDGESVIVADSPMATVQAFSLRDGTYLHHYGHEDLRVDESGQRALWDVITPAGLVYDPATRRIWFGMPMEHALCVREVVREP